MSYFTVISATASERVGFEPPVFSRWNSSYLIILSLSFSTILTAIFERLINKRCVGVKELCLSFGLCWCAKSQPFTEIETIRQQLDKDFLWVKSMIVAFPETAHRRQLIVKFANSIDCYSNPEFKIWANASLVPSGLSAALLINLSCFICRIAAQALSK